MKERTRRGGGENEERRRGGGEAGEGATKLQLLL
jgi:hypothetical protein